jgi:hypothetical protein
VRIGADRRGSMHGGVGRQVSPENRPSKPVGQVELSENERVRGVETTEMNRFVIFCASWAKSEDWFGQVESVENEWFEALKPLNLSRFCDFG